ncbi:MAG: AMP-binding protein [Pseudomonadota bacterium]
MSARAPEAVASSLPQLIRRAASQWSDQHALSCVLPNGWTASLSYGEVDQQSDRMAGWFKHVAKIKRGDVVAIQAPNILSYPVVLLGALKAGAAVSGVNPLYTARELKRQLTDCQASVLVGFDVFGALIDEVAPSFPDMKVLMLSVADGFGLVRRNLVGALAKHVKRLVPKMSVPHTRFAEALQHERATLPVAPDLALKDDEACFLAYSGGTTGDPKGVALTSRGLLINVAQVQSMSAERLQKPGLTAVLVLPLYHMYGGFMLASTLSNGGHLVLAPSPRPLSNLKAAFTCFRPDVFPGVNTLFAGLLEEEWFTEELASSIDITFSGATALSPSVRDAWRARTGSEIVESYGMTEATTVLTTNPLGAENRKGTCGVPVPGTTIRIVKDDGSVAQPGERGEVQAKGPQVMSGYRNAPELTEAAFDNGWLRTGDIGVLDEDGYLTIVDRLKDMIIVSGFNVYPGEIEDVIAAHPGVQEVGVVGLPDAKSGEVPVAFVVRSDDQLAEVAIHQLCESLLTAYKRPKDIRFVDELPKSPVGKVLRRTLREMAR